MQDYVGKTSTSKSSYILPCPLSDFINKWKNYDQFVLVDDFG